MSIAHDEIAHLFIAFHQAMAGYLQQRRVGIECNDMTYRLSADQRESFLRLLDSRFALSPVTRHLFSRRFVPAPNAPASGGGGATLPVTNNSWPDEENGFLYSVAEEMLTQGFCPDKVRPNDAVAEREGFEPTVQFT